MSRAPKLNPTVTGSFAVLIWGLALPIARYVEAEIGVLGYIGILFSTTAVLGFTSHLVRGEPLFPKGVFTNKFFYARWALFIGNMICVMTAVMVVQKKYVPVVILVNYLWPTHTILFSILFAGVKVKRRAVFVAGIVIVIAALATEVLQPDTVDASLFALPLDCLGYMLALVSGLSWGLYSVVTRLSGQASGGSRVIAMFQLSLALLLPLSFMPGAASWNHMTVAIGAIMLSWSLLQFVAFQAWDFGMRHGNIVLLSLCADFIPWLALAISQLLLGVAIGDKTIISAAMLVVGAITTRYGTSIGSAKHATANTKGLIMPPESME